MGSVRRRKSGKLRSFKEAWRDHRSRDGEAFVPDPTRGGFLSDEAEALAEEFVAAATSAEDVGEQARDEFIAEEVGGPFLELDAQAVGAWLRSEDEDDDVENVS